MKGETLARLAGRWGRAESCAPVTAVATTRMRGWLSARFRRCAGALATMVVTTCMPLLPGMSYLSGVVAAQVSPERVDFARPSLDWYVIETERFRVLFHHDESGRGSSRTARVVARVAEEVYDPITSLYGHRPDGKVTIVLKDFEDYSNGAAYFFDNKIEIWAPALKAPLRGEHNWLRNVVAHEFTHVVQVQKAMKAGRRLPFAYLQYLGYEDVKRPDVLYGYPDVIVTYPVPGLNNPAWLAEGTAQYQRSFMHYDHWDTHRDMLLRMQVLSGRELTLAEMGGFYSHSSWMREGVYNHGFAFTHYLANVYGEEVLDRITASLGKWHNWNVERAMKHATGASAHAIYEDWMGMLRREYAARTAPIQEHLVQGRLVEEKGFSNFHPRFSPDGKRLAYVSNKGEHFNRMSLYVIDPEDETPADGDAPMGAWDGSRYGGSTPLAVLDAGPASFQCSLGHSYRVSPRVAGAVTWHPDGNGLVYARTTTTPEGYRFSDLYRFDIEAKEETRLTHDARAFAPAHSPDGSKIAFVAQSDGSTNLHVFESSTKTSRALTRYEDGTQVSDPSWHPDGEWIYVALSGSGGYDIHRVSASSGMVESVLVTEADERNPVPGRDGKHLYYSSDASGIFNLYRLPLEGTGIPKGSGMLERAGMPERLTNVLGGAFMPDPAPDGRLSFARYDGEGYKIAILDRQEALSDSTLAQYTAPPLIRKQSGASAAPDPWVRINAFDDTDVRAFEGDIDTSRGAADSSGHVSEDLGAAASERRLGDPGAPISAQPSEDSEVVVSVKRSVEAPGEGGGIGPPRKYVAAFTSMSFLPVFRIDYYVPRSGHAAGRITQSRSVAGGLLRNAKLGLYFTSREVLEEIALLGGLIVGPGSRSTDGLGDFLAPSNLLKLERDAFLLIDYRRGFGFLPKRWSPQVSIELYNIRRNVENGLSIEEFPCTACYPETTLVDLSYALWEGGVYARSKVDRALLLEAGYRYSPYRVITERFFSREEGRFVSGSAFRYFIGRTFTAGAYFRSENPHRHSDVLPEKLQAEIRYELESGRLLDRFEVESGVLAPYYERDRLHRLTVEAQFGVRLPGSSLRRSHGLGLRLRGSTILGSPRDEFYDDYVGGLRGARGYPFYALGGNETLWAQAAYHFPILPDVSKQVLFAYVDKLYGRVYVDAVMAWSGGWPGAGAIRRDVGLELRLGLGSFYLVPTALFASATYGLDRFDRDLDEGFLTPDGRPFVRYGQDVLWHFGVLFDFDL